MVCNEQQHRRWRIVGLTLASILAFQSTQICEATVEEPPQDAVFTATDGNFEKEVLKNPLPVLVHFTAAWAGPSRTIAPWLRELAKQYAGKLRIAAVDVDNNPMLPQRYNVSSLPTLVLFNRGAEKKRQVGIRSKADIEKLIKEEVK